MGARLITPARSSGARLVLLSLLATLGACSGGQAPPAGSSAAPSAATRGAQLYATSCSACHQNNGQGIPHVYPSLAGSAVVNGEVGELARWVIKGQRPATLPTGRFTTVMPQYGWFKNDDAAALLTHLRSSFGNQSGAVSREDIARATGTP